MDATTFQRLVELLQANLEHLDINGSLLAALRRTEDQAARIVEISAIDGELIVDEL